MKIELSRAEGEVVLDLIQSSDHYLAEDLAERFKLALGMIKKPSEDLQWLKDMHDDPEVIREKSGYYTMVFVMNGLSDKEAVKKAMVDALQAAGVREIKITMFPGTPRTWSKELADCTGEQWYLERKE